jgi:hypothetical protein
MEQLELFPVTNDEPPSEVVQDVVMIDHTYYTWLESQAAKLIALESMGVDSWDGYAEAMQTLTTAQEGDDL